MSGLSYTNIALMAFGLTIGTLTKSMAQQNTQNYNDAKSFPITLRDGHTVDIGPRVAKAYDEHGNFDVQVVTPNSGKGQPMIVISSTGTDANGKRIAFNDTIQPTGKSNAQQVDDNGNVIRNMERIKAGPAISSKNNSTLTL
jgi:hypothetical protein